MDFVDTFDSNEDQGPFPIQYYVGAPMHVQYALDLCTQVHRTSDPDLFDRARARANDVLDYFAQFSEDALFRDHREGINSGSCFLLY